MQLLGIHSEPFVKRIPRSLVYRAESEVAANCWLACPYGPRNIFSWPICKVTIFVVVVLRFLLFFIFYFLNVDHFFKFLLKLLKYHFCFIFCLFFCEFCGILALWPEIKPTIWALAGEILTTRLPGNPPCGRCLLYICIPPGLAKCCLVNVDWLKVIWLMLSELYSLFTHHNHYSGKWNPWDKYCID